jgi:hypothetical protein
MCPVHTRGQSCARVVKCANFHVGDLRWQRWIDIQHDLIRPNAQKAKRHNLVCAPMTRQEWECGICIPVKCYIINCLLRELEPWRTKVRQEAIECIGIR